MADHDRDAGSRGEEEAPRDPMPDETAASPSARDTDVHPTQPGLRYGEIPPGPAPEDYTTTAHTMPGPTDSPQQGSGSFRDFIRQKPAQIIGAGLIGLFVGGLLGGTAVALVSDRGDRHGVWMDHDRAPMQLRMFPERLDESCYRVRGGVDCVIPPVPTNSLPDVEPTSTG
ncbi:hypothetical protein [Nonomuraea basaltis]|uniref:hypothetical protein n=1 Tax=Nonomuraea basaltis TaxID=2495887 RepID=UPI00110C616D|nr:hypothetical protein [Nonomuraea basaltis]TMR95377.1 hypothetical protein EJK15_28760 [Nonomuraea basaltis]